VKSRYSVLLNPIVIVAALGYFVDIYDLLLFSIVRVQSLASIGYEGRELYAGAILSNIQVAGLVIGGVLWGSLGDKRGRLSVLFGSIFLYSAANFANAFVEHFTQYAFCRFFAGLGLAGELGAGITLVAEVLPPKLRGIGTMIVATVGVTGAIVGGIVGQWFDWRVSFMIGGSLGFLLLIFRIGVSESSIFAKAKKSKTARRGNILDLFTSWDRFQRFACCVLVGVPIWFTIGILMTFGPEFAKHFEIQGTVTAALSVMYTYTGFMFGDFASGLVSQWLKSRNRAVVAFVALNAGTILFYLFGLQGASKAVFYTACVLLGFTSGYWAVLVTMAAEQFGTNLRATAATSVPNLVRGALIPMNVAFLSLRAVMDLSVAAAVIGGVATAISIVAILGLKETFGKDLNFLEET
jgi:MFS transporter, putative metabolite:H+ symporter